MGLISFPINVFSCKPLSRSPPSTSKSSFWRIPSLNLKPILNKQPHRGHLFGGSHPPLLKQPLVHRSLSLRAQSTGPKEGDNRAVEAVQKLYTAIKNKNIKELSDVIGDECQCFCNFVSASQPFNGKKQVLEFFDHLMKIMGDNAAIKVQFTMHEGMAVGVSWKLELENNPVPLGSGFSFYVCQEYRGKVVIRNVDMLMDPLVRLGPLKLKIMGFVMVVLDKFGWLTLFDRKRKKDIYMFLTLSFTFAVLFFLMRTYH